ALSRPTVDSSLVDVDEVFSQLRGKASPVPVVEPADQEYARAIALRDAGDFEGCISALRTASRSPQLRFAAASMLCRLYVVSGMSGEASEWFERAAEAPAPTDESRHELLFDLAGALEQEGEAARALAVCLELNADAGAYRDVADRIDRLTRKQTRG